jgi:hypothetical protein
MGTARKAAESRGFSSPAKLVKAEHLAAEISSQMADQSIGAIYRDKIRTQRTRQYELRAPKKTSSVEILYTLLGIELKVGNRRLLCPDLATARYLSVFARLGIDVIAVPYDITQISWIADELESSWRRMLLLIDHFTEGRSSRLRASVLRRLVDEIRRSLSSTGAGDKFPHFAPPARRRP